jgi:hypothetical protein
MTNMYLNRGLSEESLVPEVEVPKGHRFSFWLPREKE